MQVFVGHVKGFTLSSENNIKALHVLKIILTAMWRIGYRRARVEAGKLRGSIAVVQERKNGSMV